MNLSTWKSLTQIGRKEQWNIVTISSLSAVSCGDPGSLVNGQRIGWLFQYKNTVSFSCFEGYVLEGPENRTCLANQTWSETQPICKPVSCKEPPKVIGAVMEGGGFVYKSQVHYMCREGYQMEGSGTLTCGPNRKWVGETPVCKAIICKDPGIPQNGSRNGSEVLNYNAKLSFQCNKGFILFGSYERMCDEEGEWTGVQPYCIECAGVNTPVFIRKGMRFTHGRVKEKNDNTVTVLTEPADEEEDVVILGPGTQHYIIVQDNVPAAKDIFMETRVIAQDVKTGEYTFAKVYGKEGDKYLVSFEDEEGSVGKLSIDFIRLLDPPRFCATCPDPGRPIRGFRQDALDEFISGTEVEYGCERNTKLVGANKQKCLPSGIWSGEQPTCQVTSCWEMDVLPPANGQRTGRGFDVGSTVTFSCNQGYEMIGNSFLTCQEDGEWTGLAPICEDLCDEKHCETWEKCVYDSSISNTKCMCRKDLDCPGDYQPICGSDAKSYNNDCIMKATACREGRSIKKVADGACFPGAICQIVPTSVCRGYFRNFYFNFDTKKCEEIIAGGCHPSGWNGFTTMEDCNRTCSVDVCTQAVDPGPCAANESRWAFTPKAGRCKRFNFGGCFGNENNFPTREKCNQRCPPTVKEKEACPKCLNRKLRYACKESTFAFIGKVQGKLSEDSTKNHVRYLVVIQEVLKSPNGSLPSGTVVIRVPYKKTPSCPCPSLPKLTFILMGHVVIRETGEAPALELTITQPAMVQKWKKDFDAKFADKCANYFDIKERN